MRLVKDRFSKRRISYLILHGLLKIYSMVYYRLVFIDWSLGWVPFGIREAGRIIRQNRPDVIYVHGQPPSSFLIGFVLKRKYPIPLVIDYDDPWSCTKSHLARKSGFPFSINRFFEKRVLKIADSIVYCKESIKTDILAVFPMIPAGKFAFIPNGYDPQDFDAQPAAKAEDRFRIVYAGKLDGKFCYSPISFFAALKNLIESGFVEKSKIEVEIVGSFSKEYNTLILAQGLDSIIHSTGFLSHNKVISHVLSADALLLIIESPQGKDASYSFSGSMPSKIFEYMFSQKPILAIIPRGPERQLLEEYGPVFLADPNDSNSVKHALVNLIETSKALNRTILPKGEVIRKFDRRNLTLQLIELFTHAIKNRCA
jgi:glycosyltransferase involved in cell wall biosynthesis